MMHLALKDSNKKLKKDGGVPFLQLVRALIRCRFPMDCTDSDYRTPLAILEPESASIVEAFIHREIFRS